MEKYYKLESILKKLLPSISKQDFLVYFRKISILEINEKSLVIGVLSNFMRDNLTAKFYKKIEEVVQEEFPSIKNIEIKVDKNIENPSNADVIDCMQFYKSFGITRKSKKPIEDGSYQTDSKGKSKTLNDRYTLENFIVGSDNQLAFSAAEAVVRNPGTSYNPLYIYGDVGLGKTHILQAIGNAISKKHKDKKVLYITADKFITDYVNSVKKRSIEKLREKYREMDVLIIDDVQFLSNKEQTQNEMYNIFNILYDSDKQIVLSGDRPPKELKELEPRLRSRFEWGITIDIGKPDFETRLAIIQEKSRAREFLMPYDVAEFIASNVTENVRELEGILNQLVAEYELDGNLPTLSKVSQKLKKLKITTDLIGISKRSPNKTIKSYDDIIDAVSNYFGIEKEGILGENRKKEFMIPRQVSMYLLKTKMNYTYEKIGNIFSGRNHAAVLYSCKKLETILKKDRTLMNDLNELKENIGF